MGNELRQPRALKRLLPRHSAPARHGRCNRRLCRWGEFLSFCLQVLVEIATVGMPL